MNVGEEVMVGIFVEVGETTKGPAVFVKIWSVLVMVNVGVGVTKLESGASDIAINPMQ